MEALDSLLMGFATALTPINLMWSLVGVTLGTLIGILPGIGPALTIALLLPVTAKLDATGAFIMFAGLYYGAMYGGSTTSILLNTPGESGTIITALEGNRMARRGRGAFRNGSRIRCSRQPKLERALLCTGFPYEPAAKRRNLSWWAAFIPRAQAVRRVGSAALDLCWTAAGVFDGFWEFRLGPWDVAAGALIAREAGATVTDFKGRPVDLSKGEVLVANRTDPGWVPLFPCARAVVVERGSVLSHSAIVAREFGIPCVVGVRDALARLREGQLVEVDGGAGTVTAVED